MANPRTTLLRRVAQWIAVLGTAGVALGTLLILSFIALSERDLVLTLLREHVRAIVGLPIAAVSAFCIVVVLEATSGNIEFEALGFKFRGASGPVVLWVLSFIVFVLAIRVLW